MRNDLMASDDYLCHFNVLKMIHDTLICSTQKTNHSLIICWLEFIVKMIKNFYIKVIIEELKDPNSHTGNVDI